jgi:ribosomal protein S18 acetylase RimI-like enzyme
VAALWGRVFADDRPWNAAAVVVARKLARRDGLFWVAVRDGRIVGAVMAGYDGQRGWIYHLAVDAPVRRRGLGRALVRVAEAALATAGCPKVNLQVLAGNGAGVAFWQRLGFAIEDRVSMGKTLAARRRVARA